MGVRFRLSSPNSPIKSPSAVKIRSGNFGLYSAKSEISGKLGYAITKDTPVISNSETMAATLNPTIHKKKVKSQWRGVAGLGEGEALSARRGSEFGMGGAHEGALHYKKGCSGSKKTIPRMAPVGAFKMIIQNLSPTVARLPQETVTSLRAQ